MLKNDTLLNGELIKAGTQIEATAEIQELLKPFGYEMIKSIKEEKEEISSDKKD